MDELIYIDKRILDDILKSVEFQNPDSCIYCSNLVLGESGYYCVLLNEMYKSKFESDVVRKLLKNILIQNSPEVNICKYYKRVNKEINDEE